MSEDPAWAAGTSTFSQEGPDTKTEATKAPLIKIRPVRLQPVLESHLDLFDRLLTEPELTSPYMWRGFQPPQVVRQRWSEDGFLGTNRGKLIAVDPDDDAVVGVLSWVDALVMHQPGWSLEIGVVVLPEYRGVGFGRAIHLALCEYLFAHTAAHRISALTERSNEAECRVLEAVGFRREGVMRQASFRAGVARDVVLYGLVRPEFAEVNSSARHGP